MALDLAVFQSPTGARFVLATNQAQGVTLSSNEHGYEKCSLQVPAPAGDAFGLYNGPVLHVEAGDPGCVWKGRLEDPTLLIGNDPASLKLDALGYWSAFNDVPYTQFWSTTTTQGWQAVTDAAAGYQDKRYSFDTNNRLLIAPTKGAAQDVGNIGGLTFVVPSGSPYGIVGISFDYQLIAPTTWLASLDLYSSSDYSVYTATPWSLSANTTLQSGTIHATFGNTRRLVFNLYYNTTTTATYTGESGAAYLKVTNMRMVADTTSNRINTTLTAARAAGSSATATVASTTRMYVGQQLQIQSGTNGETVTVQTIVSGTQFTANFVRAHPSGSAVQAHAIYADTIALDILAATASTNPTQISASPALIQSPGLDLTDEIYEDLYPADILTRLAGLGDTQGRSWEVQIWEDQRLVLRPQFSASRAWYIDVTSIDVARTLNQLRNSAYAAYQDASGGVLRTAINTDTASVATNGITRRAKVEAQTTSNALANYLRDVSLANTKNPAPRATISFDRVFDATGARWPLWAIRAGDTLTIRNLPPTGGAIVDRIRTFRLTRSEYHADDNTIGVEPELPPALLEVQVNTH